jgi:putative spermidine/putrescine transport system permease protein
VVNVVAAVLVLVSVLPIWAAQRLSTDNTGGRL